MSLLSYNRLVELVNQGVITNTPLERINSTSIDITLGDTILWEKSEKARSTKVMLLRDRKPLNMGEHKFVENYDVFYMRPGQFILAHSEQVFNLPNNISAEYKLKSSMARIGLDHLNAGWCDAGWNNSVLTLEIKNMTQKQVIGLKKGDAIGQMVFFEHEPVPYERSYAARGRYNGDKSVMGIKK